MKTIAFFNSTAGVGTTTLVYHLASMMAERGARVLAVDLDPQAGLTRMCLTEEQIQFWQERYLPYTVLSGLRFGVHGIYDVMLPDVIPINEGFSLMGGDAALAALEDKFSWGWTNCRIGDEQAFQTMAAFHQLIRKGAGMIGVDWVLIDVGPNLGAINRAALIASERVVIPLGPDLFSLQGLRNLGPALRSWRESWRELLTKNPDPSLDLPAGEILPLGYVVMQHGMRENRPPKAYLRWIERFPVAYRESVLAEPVDAVMEAAYDPFCLAMLKHYRSLMPMAMEARKPVFALKPADGAIGAHNEAVRRAYEDFQKLAARIVQRSGILH